MIFGSRFRNADGSPPLTCRKHSSTNWNLPNSSNTGAARGHCCEYVAICTLSKGITNPSAYNVTFGGAGNTLFNYYFSSPLTKNGTGTLFLTYGNTSSSANTVNAGALVVGEWNHH